MKTYTPYQRRIRDCFTAAYSFIEKYAPVRSEEAWHDIAENLSQYNNDPFMSDLIVACIAELEREHKTYKDQK